MTFSRPCGTCAHTIRTHTHNTHTALAEAATPYGIESFDDVLEPLWRGIRSLRGKVCSVYNCQYETAPILRVLCMELRLSVPCIAFISCALQYCVFDDVLEPLWRGVRSLRGKVCTRVGRGRGRALPQPADSHT